MRNLSTGLMVLALFACGKDHKNNDTAKKPESQNPSVTPANPAQDASPSLIPPELLGSWSICSEFAQDETSDGFKLPAQTKRTSNQFEANGTLTRTFTFHTDKSCTKQVTEADLQKYIENLEAAGIKVEDADELMLLSQAVELKAKFSMVASLGMGQFQYNTILPDNETIFSTLQLTADTLTLAYECGQDDVDSGFCAKLTGDSAQNRAVIDSKATVMKKFK